MLDHLKATKRRIADRYVLGELSQPQREEFEEHYFECMECAEDVRAFLALSSNSRSVLVDVPDYAEPAAATGWKRLGWFQALRSWRLPAIYAMAPALALCGVIVTTTYQSITLQSQLVAQAVPEVALRPDSRGEEIEIGVQKLGNFLVLAADVAGTPREVKWQIRSLGSLAPLMQGTAPAPPLGASLTILLPVSKLSTGHYVLAIRPDGIPSETGAEVVYRFRMH